MADLKALTENRKEHIQYLEDVLLEAVLEEFSDIYQSVISKSKVLQEFQNELGKIVEWNHVMIGAAYERVKKRSGCKFLPDLLRAIFTTSVKCHLMTHGKMDAMNEIRFRVPTAEKFIHRLLIACAQHIWKQPYLFYHAVRSIERQYNRGKIEDIIRKQVESTIRMCLPLEQLVSIIHHNIEEEPDTVTEESSSDDENSDEEESSSDESSEEEVSDVESSDASNSEEEEEPLDSDVNSSVIDNDDENDEEEDMANMEIERIIVESDDEEAFEIQNKIEEDSEKLVATITEKLESQPQEFEEPLDETLENEIEPEKVATIPEKLESHPQEPEEPLDEPLENKIESEKVATEENEEPALQYFNELVKSLEDEPVSMVSDASSQKKSIEIITSSSSSSSSEKGDTSDQVRTVEVEGDRKIIPLKGLLINQRKLHRPKMTSRVKRSDNVVDAFY